MIRHHGLKLTILVCTVLLQCTSVPETIKDIQELRQDHLCYIDPSRSQRDVVPVDFQRKMDVSYNTLFFAPWHQESSRYERGNITKEFAKYKKYPGYGENGRKHTKKWIRDLENNALLEEYPNSGVKAITLYNADLRVLPTDKPCFYGPLGSLKGYPFDSLQRSLIAANTPVYISHVSRDRAWYFVETPYAPGWMSAKNVAIVDDSFAKSWERGKYAVIIRDRIPLCSEENVFLFHASLGSLFPLDEENDKGVRICVAVADSNRKAVMQRAVVSKDSAVRKPLKLTILHVGKLANELINEAYGWGGLYGNRDCSSLLRDLFAPFGIWLPRHSADQAREGGISVDLRNLSLQEKELMVIKFGVPYLTLLYKKGHIMLYVGHHQGKILVFHNMWGVVTRDMLGKKGKKIVGHAAITTLYPGREYLNDAFPEDFRVYDLAAMVFLVPPEGEVSTPFFY